MQLDAIEEQKNLDEIVKVQRHTSFDEWRIKDSLVHVGCGVVLLNRPLPFDEALWRQQPVIDESLKLLLHHHRPQPVHHEKGVWL